MTETELEQRFRAAGLPSFIAARTAREDATGRPTGPASIPSAVNGYAGVV